MTTVIAVLLLQNRLVIEPIVSRTFPSKQAGLVCSSQKDGVLVVIGRDALHILDAGTLKEKHVLEGQAYSVAFNTAGDTLLVVWRDNIQLISVQDWKAKRKVDGKKLFDALMPGREADLYITAEFEIYFTAQEGKLGFAVIETESLRAGPVSMRSVEELHVGRVLSSKGPAVLFESAGNRRLAIAKNGGLFSLAVANDLLAAEQLEVGMVAITRTGSYYYDSRVWRLRKAVGNQSNTAAAVYRESELVSVASEGQLRVFRAEEPESILGVLKLEIPIDRLCIDQRSGILYGASEGLLCSWRLIEVK